MGMSIEIETGDISEAIELLKEECHEFENLSAYEVNKLAIELVAASNIFDSATLISDSIDNLVDND